MTEQEIKEKMQAFEKEGLDRAIGGLAQFHRNGEVRAVAIVIVDDKGQLGCTYSGNADLEKLVTGLELIKGTLLGKLASEICLVRPGPKLGVVKEDGEEE